MRLGRVRGRMGWALAWARDGDRARQDIGRARAAPGRRLGSGPWAVGPGAVDSQAEGGGHLRSARIAGSSRRTGRPSEQQGRGRRGTPRRSRPSVPGGTEQPGPARVVAGQGRWGRSPGSARSGRSVTAWGRLDEDAGPVRVHRLDLRGTGRVGEVVGRSGGDGAPGRGGTGRPPVAYTDDGGPGAARPPAPRQPVRGPGHIQTASGSAGDRQAVPERPRPGAGRRPRRPPAPEPESDRLGSAPFS